MKKALALTFTEFGSPDKVLKLATINLPPLSPNAILLEFVASPVNPSDINQVQGVYPVKACKYDDTINIGGNEGLAKVAQVGDQVQELAVGDWVIPKSSGFGTWRTHAVCTSEQVIKLDIDNHQIDPLFAATLAVNPCSAYRMLKDFCTLKPGDTVIQNAANSGVGQAVIQLAKAWGIQTINVIRQRPNFDEVATDLLALGATTVVAEDNLRSKMEELSREYRPKLALNAVGGDSATNIARCLDQNGVLVTYGGMSRQPVQLPTTLFIFKNIQAVGFWMTRWNQEKGLNQRKEMIDEILELHRQGKFEPVWHHKVNWSLPNLEAEIKQSMSESTKTVFWFEQDATSLKV